MLSSENEDAKFLSSRAIRDTSRLSETFLPSFWQAKSGLAGISHAYSTPHLRGGLFGAPISSLLQVSFQDFPPTSVCCGHCPLRWRCAFQSSAAWGPCSTSLHCPALATHLASLSLGKPVCTGFKYSHPACARAAAAANPALMAVFPTPVLAPNTAKLASCAGKRTAMAQPDPKQVRMDRPADGGGSNAHVYVRFFVPRAKVVSLRRA
mmetsp:Transcript_4364/g.27780  ORF Transcript_4364/g.27780 Transcript_4364/m.27780 type:complete len:208 (+) Transcript_4364:4888-5511(+)